tara:strand:- start:3102 stop:3371 length:270 start_codon:yes stop_codon:yes gene_type:complete
MEIIGYICICTTAMFIYSTINMMKKVEELEEIIEEQDLEYFDIQQKIRTAISNMREIDSKQAFEKDDEVGDIFSSLLSIVEKLGEKNED